jgi:hypothetical protein
MQIDLKVIISILGSISFLIAIWKKPSIPIKALIFSLIVFFFSFYYQQSRPTKTRFLPVDNSFILLYEERNEDSELWQGYTCLYGTQKSIEETRKYYWSLSENKSISEKIASIIPGGELVIAKQIHEYGNIKEGLLLDFQYGTGDSASIDITSPPTWKKADSYKTAVYIQYSLAKNEYIKGYFAIAPLIIIMAILWMWLIVSFVKVLKKALLTLSHSHK